MTINSYRKDTHRWHFIDIDIEPPTYDASLDRQDGSNQGTCIVQGLPAAIAIVKGNSRLEADRLRELKLVVHLAGDLEQPLHVSEHNGDQGGRQQTSHRLARKRSCGATYTRASIFHSMWDDSLVDLQANCRLSACDGHKSQLLPPGTLDRNLAGHGHRQRLCRGHQSPLWSASEMSRASQGYSGRCTRRFVEEMQRFRSTAASNSLADRFARGRVACGLATRPARRGVSSSQIDGGLTSPEDGVIRWSIVM
ncbi:S1/P1 nuclease [Bradyrhizobium sp. ISRA442]|uniref:S1/P1 nuclease n=1 Tax=Bradyrhizobium sp. ISRA442 TaxID=2866197 RepID=UPI00404AD6AB